MAVLPELVEGLLFFAVQKEKAGQPFDKLREGGDKGTQRGSSPAPFPNVSGIPHQLTINAISTTAQVYHSPE
jgi:hypothetical protein